MPFHFSGPKGRGFESHHFDHLGGLLHEEKVQRPLFYCQSRSIVAKKYAISWSLGHTNKIVTFFYLTFMQ